MSPTEARLPRHKALVVVEGRYQPVGAVHRLGPGKHPPVDNSSYRVTRF